MSPAKTPAAKPTVPAKVPAALTPAAFEPLLADRIGDLEVMLAGTDVSPDRFIKSTIHALAKYPNVLRAKPADVLLAVLECAEMGLEPTGAFGGAHLVTFQAKDGTVKVQVITDYRGLIKMAMRTGQVTAVMAEIVYEGDGFAYELGTHPGIQHYPISDHEKRGEPTHVYATAKLPNGDYIFTVMTMPEVLAIKARSRASSSGPWVSDPGWMIRKTAVRQLFKLHPAVVSSAMAKALEREDALEVGEPLVVAPVVGASDRRQRLIARMAGAQGNPPPEPAAAAVRAAPEATDSGTPPAAATTATAVVAPPEDDGLPPIPETPAATAAEEVEALADLAAEVTESAAAEGLPVDALCGDPSPYGDGAACARPAGHGGAHASATEPVGTW